ncbi:MAG: A/G-specific adenine glycosylase [Candidatus Levybacteria bacterium]|nr:A/G-specific adenine glycosylase [Candidatus Levybacteria bacterium]
MELTQRNIKLFQDKILLWYKNNKRDLPWRKTREPYHILVSEIMSQQTQLSRVIPKFEAWMNYFPTIDKLARASQAEVLGLWSGLGYNSRAIRLQKAVQVVLEEYRGVFPREVDDLLKLPGVGKYTASALACFAFDAQIPVVDTNVRKVIAHELCGGKLPTDHEIEKIALKILPSKKAYVWNQALMDYSAGALRHKKIPVPKQSHFLTSDRYYRGQIIKILLRTPMSMSGFIDYFSEQNPINPARLEAIIKKMKKESLIHASEGKFTLVALAS